jgi:hypothetical protein
LVSANKNVNERTEMDPDKDTTEKKILREEKEQKEREKQDLFPIEIRESQGDRADQAEMEIENDLQDEIERGRRGYGVCVAADKINRF